jgi:hypothetical protein
LVADEKKLVEEQKDTLVLALAQAIVASRGDQEAWKQIEQTLSGDEPDFRWATPGLDQIEMVDCTAHRLFNHAAKLGKIFSLEGSESSSIDRISLASKSV